MNGDAAEALTRARSRAAQSAGQSSPPPVAAPVRAAVPEQVVRLVPEPPPPPPRRDFVVEHESEARVADVVPAKAAPPSGEIETYDGTLDFNSVAHDAAKAEGLEVQEEVAIKPQELEVEGLAATQYESGRFAARADATPEPEPDMPTVDLPLIMPEDVAPRSPSPPQLPAGPTPLAPPELPAAVPPAAAGLWRGDGAADTAARARAEPAVTGTRAVAVLNRGPPR